MNQLITPKDKEILECLLAGWVEEGNFLLYSNLSYQDVQDFCRKFELTPETINPNPQIP